MTIIAETRVLGSEQGIVKSDTWITLYILVSTTMQRNSKEKDISQRPGFREAEEKLMNLQKGEESPTGTSYSSK